MMSHNVGVIDRLARIVVGLALIAFAIPIGFPSLDWNWVGWIGIVPIVTAITGSCPAYSLIGIKTSAR